MARKNPAMHPPHQLEIDQALTALDSRTEGLTEKEASRRLHQFGPNTMPVAAPRTALMRLFAQLHNVFIYMLLASGTASWLLGHSVDAGVIFAVVVVNTLVGYLQEGKAEQALSAIRALSVAHTTVLRDNQTRTIDATQLVPGDIILLQAGDKVPADARIIYAKDLQCDEAALTGESQPVNKSTRASAANTPLAEQHGQLHMGTLITRGSARALVSSTGTATELGNISQLVARTRLEATPLQVQLARFAQAVAWVIAGLCVVIFLIGFYLHDFTAGAMLQAAIGIAVASIPEGLPAIVTITLAIGVRIMAKRHALVRRLPSVEVLGSVDVICTDKTGTLTTNTMTARLLVSARQTHAVEGEGYRPEGHIADDSPGNVMLAQALWIAHHCNDATLNREGDNWLGNGDPTEVALRALAAKGRQPVNMTERLDELPFDTEKRYMATLHSVDNQFRVAIKGAPEKLLAFASQQQGPEGPEALDADYWHEQIQQLADSGMRVMALASRTLDQPVLNHQSVESGLVFVGLVGISDPPRAEAIDSIRRCHAAGIRIKMITGDNPLTARAIGAELGLNAERVVTGAELDTLSDEALQALAWEVDIFARTSPFNKLQLVQALQARKHTVAMTGDGVNDAPALKQANIGVGMGKKGTDAAREASDIVLTDDNFATIAAAVEQGRTVYANIVKAILFILPTSVAEALVIVVAIALGTSLPITPAQVLWINMITAVTLALALGFEPGEPEQMRLPPRPAGQALVTPGLLLRTLLVGGAAAAIVFSLFSHYQHQAGDTLARTVAVNALVLIEAFYLINCRFLHSTIFSSRLWQGAVPSLLAIGAVIAIQLGFTYWPASQALFELAPMALTDWGVATLCALGIVCIVECEKAVQRHIFPLPTG